MEPELSEKEALATLRLPQEARLDYFMIKAREWNQVWTLAQGEELMVLDDESDHAFVLAWPHPEYAQQWFAGSDLEEADLVAMNIEDWTKSALPELAGTGVGVEVFPTPDEEGTYVEAAALAVMMGAAA